jgi:hypothetical protein
MHFHAPSSWIQFHLANNCNLRSATLRLFLRTEASGNHQSNCCFFLCSERKETTRDIENFWNSAHGQAEYTQKIFSIHHLPMGWCRCRDKLSKQTFRQADHMIRLLNDRSFACISVQCSCAEEKLKNPQC